jgi:hypothetical protein
MYKIIKWNPTLDLTEFYQEASRRGFDNNSSQEAMIDCFRNEPEWAAWILYKDDRAVGSVVAHTFDVMGPTSYRVLARTCSFGDARPSSGLITTKRLIAEHQNLTDQFLLPICIEWAGHNKNLYATSNNSCVASQRLVHNHYFPTLAKLGIVEWVCDINYRSTDQSVWRINVSAFEENLNKYPRWT